mgnify:CR=1 FL=1
MTRRKIFITGGTGYMGRALVAELVGGVQSPECVVEHPQIDRARYLLYFLFLVDVVVLMSNGGFGGIHDKILEALAK